MRNDLAVSAALRIAEYGIYGAFSSAMNKSAAKGAALGLSYVVCRCITSLFANVVIDQIQSRMSDENNQKYSPPLGAAVYSFLLIPTIPMASKIYSLIDNSVSFNNTMLASTVVSVAGLVLGIGVGGMITRGKFKLPFSVNTISICDSFFYKLQESKAKTHQR